jgi:cation diffusion facilitator family transporter
MMPSKETPRLTRYARISIATALATIVLKSAAYWLTGSVGLLSDAVESLVNLAGGIMALWMLTVAARPADEDHAYGHGKAEYFSSGVEGSLIVLAAASIAWAAIPRLLAPQELEGVGAGLAVSVLASLINLGSALVILRAGKRYGSITLEANARHLLTDVWTSVGVIAAVALVPLTGWLWLDPVIALVVAANIIWTGVGIIRRSVSGLMDKSISNEDRAVVDAVLAKHLSADVSFHAVWTRQAGTRKFVTLHVLVPGDWTVQRGHELLELIEDNIREALPGSHVMTHIEPREDPLSFEDEKLERKSQNLRKI